MSPDPKRDKQDPSPTAPTRKLSVSELQRYRRAAREGRPPSDDTPGPVSTQKMDAEQLRRFRRAAAEGQPAPAEAGPRLVRAASIPWEALSNEEGVLLAWIDGRRDRAAVIDGSGLGKARASELLDSLIGRGLASVAAGEE